MIFDIQTEDVEYLSHQGLSLRARIYRPHGAGPFPAMVDVHGGAWIEGNLLGNNRINRPVAAGGVVIMAIDYRLPPAGIYPCSVADVNYAVRWLKKNAERFGARAELVGAMGTSAGGHLAVLAGLKPYDPRYAELPLQDGERFDARVNCVVTMWPVICPLTRYRENIDRKQRDDQLHAGRVGAGLDQMKYWVSEAAMADGSPVLALERGDHVGTPDMLYVQATGDLLHPRHSMDRFCAAYRKAGGRVEELLVKGEPYDLVRSMPDSLEATRAVRGIIAFINASKERAGAQRLLQTEAQS